MLSASTKRSGGNWQTALRLVTERAAPGHNAPQSQLSIDPRGDRLQSLHRP